MRTQLALMKNTMAFSLYIDIVIYRDISIYTGLTLTRKSQARGGHAYPIGFDEEHDGLLSLHIYRYIDI